MATNQDIAQSIITAYVRVRQSDGPVFLSYAMMAVLIGRSGQHRLLGAPLDIVRDMCRDYQVPDIATMIVNSESLKDGTLRPSDAAIEKHGGWQGLRKEQAKALAFDWSSFEIG